MALATEGKHSTSPLVWRWEKANSPSIIFHSGDVSSPFPFRIGYVLDYVCRSGSLSNDGGTDSVFIH